MSETKAIIENLHKGAFTYYVITGGEGGRWTEMITFDYDIFGGGGVLFLGDYVSKFSEILNEDLT